MTSKVCTICKARKDLNEFSTHPKMLDGRQSNCRACVNERCRKSRVGRPCLTCGTPMPSDARPYSKTCDECLKKCTQCGAPRILNQRICKDCQAKSDSARKSTSEAKFKERIARIKSKYKVRPTLAAMLAAYQRCEACGKESSRPNEIHVDHCHTSGDVRGLLCFNCNAALGHVNDSVDRLKKLVEYLQEKSEFQKLKDLAKASHYVDLLMDLERSRGVNK